MTWIRKIWRGSRLIWGRVALVLWLLRHPTVPRSAKILALLAVAYGVMPLDLVPDFIPALGQLDDLVLVPMLIMVALAKVLHATLGSSASPGLFKPHSGTAYSPVESAPPHPRRFVKAYPRTEPAG